MNITLIQAGGLLFVFMLDMIAMSISLTLISKEVYRIIKKKLPPDGLLALMILLPLPLTVFFFFVVMRYFGLTTGHLGSSLLYTLIFLISYEMIRGIIKIITRRKSKN